MAIFDNRMRLPVELLPATVLLSEAVLLALNPSTFFPFLPAFSSVISLCFLILGTRYTLQGIGVLRYHRALRTLPRYILAGKDVPISQKRLFIGRGFRWTQVHSQRLLEARASDAQKYLRQSIPYRLARKLEIKLEKYAIAAGLIWLLSRDSRLNPVRPLSAVHGDPGIHGVGLEEEDDIWIDLGERVGHCAVFGQSRVGKSRLAEILILQDIRRGVKVDRKTGKGVGGDVVVVLDPKNDVDLLRRMIAETKRVNRMHHFHIVSLSFPELSEFYNPIGSFAKITEIAGRSTNALPGEGSSAAFKAFSWRFTNIVAQALVGLGIKPTYKFLARYVTTIEPLFCDYMHCFLDKDGPKNWRSVVQEIESDFNLLKRVPKSMIGRDLHAIALYDYYKSSDLYDSVVDGLKGVIEYDKTYYDKLTASLLPFLEKLVTGRSGALLTPVYSDRREKRPVLDLRKLVREGGILYVALDAQADFFAAEAFSAAFCADLNALSSELYKYSDTRGLPSMLGHKPPRVALHADEFSNLLVGDSFLPLVNKSGGSGFQCTVYTQTSSDIEAGTGSTALAGQVLGNFNTMIMMRVAEEQTAKLLIEKLPKVPLYTKVPESRLTDNDDRSTPIDFVSQNIDRIQQADTEILSTADIVSLPKGQAFCVTQGGELYKIRIPLAPANDPLMPKDIAEIREERLRHYGMLDVA